MVVEITSITNRCFTEVQAILSKSNLTMDVLFKELKETVQKIATDTIGIKENISCSTKYSPSNSPELLLWALGLVCEVWVLEILRQKAQEGHCHTHSKPCLEGKKFHENLYIECKKSFKELFKNAQESNITQPKKSASK